MLFEHMAQVKFVYKKRGAYLVQGELFPNVLIDVHHNCGKLVVGLVWRKAMIRAEIKYFKESAGIIPADGRLQKAEFCLNSFTGVIIQDTAFVEREYPVSNNQAAAAMINKQNLGSRVGVFGVFEGISTAPAVLIVHDGG